MVIPPIWVKTGFQKPCTMSSLYLKPPRVTGVTSPQLTEGKLVPQTIVFDTNYLRTFSQTEYLAGKLPEKLKVQISRAVERGDLVALVDTVRIETNAWLEVAHQKKQQDLNASIQRLIAEGYTVTPGNVPDSAPPDILPLLQLASEKCSHLFPTIDDYREAERRTSYRQAPYPKNTDGEEMRDRLIWCQMLRWSAESGNPVLIVSNDTIFKNGAKSEEGVHARISVVEGEVDLDQRLGERPDHIAALVRSILVFAPELKEQGINLTEATIVGVEELRKVQEVDGSITQRFLLLTSGDANLDVRCATTMNSIGDQPISIVMATTPLISLVKRVTEQEKIKLDRRPGFNSQDEAINELRQLIRSR